MQPGRLMQRLGATTTSTCSGTSSSLLRRQLRAAASHHHSSASASAAAAPVASCSGRDVRTHARRSGSGSSSQQQRVPVGACCVRGWCTRTRDLPPPAWRDCCTHQRCLPTPTRRTHTHTDTAEKLEWAPPLGVIRYPDPRLRAVNARVGVFDDSLRELARSMLDVMYT